MEHPRLLVLGVPMRDLFLMKLSRADPNDVADMVVMWPDTGFASAREVIDAFYLAYPLAPEDDFLDDFIIEIAGRADYDLPRS